MKLSSRKECRQRRHSRVRRKVHGTAECPRMSIMVSGKNIYVQFINDDSSVTVAAVSTVSFEKNKNIKSAVLLGDRVVAEANNAGIQKVVVDRGGHKFHGRVKAVVDAAVKAGLLPGPKSEGKSAAEDKEDQ